MQGYRDIETEMKHIFSPKTIGMSMLAIVGIMFMIKVMMTPAGY